LITQTLQVVTKIKLLIKAYSSEIFSEKFRRSIRENPFLSYKKILKTGHFGNLHQKLGYVKINRTCGTTSTA